MSHLYAIKFSNGAIKVGRSTTPKARIATHAERVACVGITVAETVIAECVGDPVDSEALLIENCKKYMQSFHPSESATITGTEWFSHLLDWPSVLLWVEQIAAAKIRIERLKRLTLEDVIGEDDEPPMSRHQLWAALHCVNAIEAAELANVSTKTIYRLRQNVEYMPTLATYQSLVKAVKTLSKRKAKAEVTA
jgi:hypothetical protein